MKTYTTVELAKHLGVGRDTVYRWMGAGKIKGVKVSKIGNIKVRLWTSDDIALIREYMKLNYRKGRGRKPKR